jgi:hypothetical protein
MYVSLFIYFWYFIHKSDLWELDLSRLFDFLDIFNELYLLSWLVYKLLVSLNLSPKTIVWEFSRDFNILKDGESSTLFLKHDGLSCYRVWLPIGMQSSSKPWVTDLKFKILGSKKLLLLEEYSEPVLELG